MIYLSNIYPVKEFIAAHEICHGLLYASGFKVIKHKKNKFDFFEGQVVSFAHHFPLNEILKKYNLYNLYYKENLEIQSEDQIKKNLQFFYKTGYDGSDRDKNVQITFQCLGFLYKSSRAARKRLERLMKLLPSEIYNKYKSIRKIINNISKPKLITPSGCMKVMTEILKLYGTDNEFIKDFNGFDDYLSYDELLGQ